MEKITSIEQFNQLNAREVSREELQRLKHTAKEESQFHIFEKLDRILSQYPQAERFFVELMRPLKPLKPKTESKEKKGLGLPTAQTKETVAFNKAILKAKREGVTTPMPSRKPRIIGRLAFRSLLHGKPIATRGAKTLLETNGERCLPFPRT